MVLRQYLTTSVQADQLLVTFPILLKRITSSSRCWAAIGLPRLVSTRTISETTNSNLSRIILPQLPSCPLPRRYGCISIRSRHQITHNCRLNIDFRFSLCIMYHEILLFSNKIQVVLKYDYLSSGPGFRFHFSGSTSLSQIGASSAICFQSASDQAKLCRSLPICACIGAGNNAKNG